MCILRILSVPLRHLGVINAHVQCVSVAISTSARSAKSGMSADHCPHVLPTLQHVVVGVVSHREQMGRHLVLPLSLEFVGHVLIVDGQAAIGVDGDAEEARIGL